MNRTASQVALTALSLGTDHTRVVKLLSHDATRTMFDAIIEPDAVLSLNQKACMRLAQSSAFAVSGDMKALDKGTATLVAMIALSAQSRIVFDDARYLMGELVDGAQHVAGVSRQRLHRFIGIVGRSGTIRSKLSRTVSKRGFFSALGITTKSDAHECTLTPNAKSHPLILAYAAQLQRVTDDQFELLTRE